MATNQNNTPPTRGVNDILRNKGKYDPLGDLYGVDKKIGGVRANHLYFPGDIESIQHWVSFRVFNYQFNRSESTTNQKTSVCNIFLPIPANLSTSYRQNYGPEELGPLGAAFGVGSANMVEAVADYANGGSTGLQLADKIKNQIAGMKGSVGAGALKNLAAEAAEKDIGAFAGAAIAGPMGAIAAHLAERSFRAALASEGIARNPHMTVLYQGPDFRHHTFQYKLVARNKQESDTIHNIISALKYYQAPGYNNGGHFFTYPEQFEIDFRFPDYLFNIGPSVLTGFDVNYHGEGMAAYFHTKAPVSVTISMSFLENTITTKQEIEKYNR